ncbi:pilus assembly protein PilZ [Aggregicoccus sp. 17bor-14]|nr:pilus assembly protein PilZ [Aggregicoccus sp. 17bor-14]
MKSLQAARNVPAYVKTPAPKAPPGTPTVRLKVSYKSPAALLGEFTRSVGQGVVALETQKDVGVGTRFVFELHASGVEAPVEVLGEVVQVAVQPSGRRLLTVRYDAGGDRAGLDAVLQRIFDTHEHEKMRRFPRIPLNLRATEDAPFSPAFLVRDISRGGLGLEVEAPALPRSVRVGTPFLLEMSMSLGQLPLHGEVVWTTSTQTDRTPALAPGFGVQFGKLRLDIAERLEQLLALSALPPAPWRARVSFGMDAVSRMP